jgi:exodeoxyribonuclease V gamma subunit
MVDGPDSCGNPTHVLPFDDREGQSIAYLGTFVDFLNTLFEVTDSLREPRSMQAWVSALEEAVERLTATSKAASWLMLRTRQVIRDLEPVEHGERVVSREAVTSALQGSFDIVGRATKEQSGAVVFCALRPMRSIPYRVVVLLGMDEGKLPRKDNTLAFDLSAIASRAGDPCPSDEDRHLVLEALLSAKEHLIVLYTGRDPNTNEHRAACVPIGELRVVIDRRFEPPEGAETASGWMTKQHPLQPFGESSFLSIHRNPSQPDTLRPWSFDRRLLSSALVARGPRTALPFYTPLSPLPDREVPKQATVHLDDLISFFRTPTAFLLRRRWKLWLGERAEGIDDREPVELDALERWALRQTLLEGRLAGGTEAQVGARIRAEGKLPHESAGNLAVQEQIPLVNSLLEATGIWPIGAKAPQQAAASHGVDIPLSTARLLGTVHPIYEPYLFEFRFSSEEGTQSLIRLWLSLLAWRASDPEAGWAVLVTLDSGKPASGVKFYAYQAPTNAAEVLDALVGIYQKGCVEPIKLFAGASWEFAWAARTLASIPNLFTTGLPEDRKHEKTLSSAYNKALKTFFPGFNHKGDMGDPSVARIFDGQSPMTDPNQSPVPLDLEFARLAMTLWGPLLQGRRTDKDVRKWFGGKR